MCAPLVESGVDEYLTRLDLSENTTQSNQPENYVKTH
jgi:hypothetical protein